jgi:uncharacterized protein (TIGR02757 family)
MDHSQLKDFLEYKADQYNSPEFIETDPVMIPHLFSKKEDIEISGFLTALISWGNRPAIIKAAKHMMALMDNDPYAFILHSEEYKNLKGFYYRTFQSEDVIYYLKALRHLYAQHGGPEAVFMASYKTNQNVFDAISHLRSVFFSLPYEQRQLKHFSSPEAGSAAKRINMFLRWMCRKDKSGVDFGIWKDVSPTHLICPLDLHSGRVARKLGLLKRKQNDRKAAEELTMHLRELDPLDPVKYDFALFGLGVFEKF